MNIYEKSIRYKNTQVYTQEYVDYLLRKYPINMDLVSHYVDTLSNKRARYIYRYTELAIITGEFGLWCRYPNDDIPALTALLFQFFDNEILEILEQKNNIAFKLISKNEQREHLDEFIKNIRLKKLSVSKALVKALDVPLEHELDSGVQKYRDVLQFNTDFQYHNFVYQITDSNDQLHMLIHEASNYSSDYITYLLQNSIINFTFDFIILSAEIGFTTTFVKLPYHQIEEILLNKYRLVYENLLKEKFPAIYTIRNTFQNDTTSSNDELMIILKQYFLLVQKHKAKLKIAIHDSLESEFNHEDIFDENRLVKYSKLFCINESLTYEAFNSRASDDK